MSEFYWLNPFLGESESEPILRDVFDGWGEGNGIFSYLARAGEMPWSEDSNVESSVLDLSYFGNHSGGKFCAPLIKILLDENGKVPDSVRPTLAKVLVAKYLPNWTSLWRTNVASYDPIHNYNMYEERDLTTTEDEEKVTDGTLLRTGTDTLQHGKAETTSHGRTDETDLYKYGLNTGVNPKQSDKTVDTEGGQTVVTDSGSDVDTRNLTDKNDVSEVLDNDGTEHEEIHRYGNIGVTTTQKLIQEERNLWLWNYFDQIFADIDREFALAFHDSCRV